MSSFGDVLTVLPLPSYFSVIAAYLSKLSNPIHS